ncbi:hypothetical protein HGRIS_004619 [Hohenbuehelia grisea]|uniref:Class E vacuolar protein-sorting machinery protein HSE1 n=1 Tax=Hohenbuehelia grisea TaxID=104357 RepID=A0ABR3JE41_9AGAR
MFGGGASNPYDDIVVKTTDENLTSENWELILNLCDKVLDEGQEGARNVIAAILKRLAHRNPNVQLYALTLAEALSKNCAIEVHREIASRAFTQGLEKLITDRNTHDKVKRRALSLIAQWTAEFENDSTLGVMEDCYKNLKTKNFKFETPQEAPPPTVDDDIRRKEEEELQRVLEMSMQDKGGRDQWSQYSLAANDPGASTSAGGSSAPAGRSSLPDTTNTTSHSKAYNQPLYQSGYVPARTPSPKPQSPVPTSPVHASPVYQPPPPAETAPIITSSQVSPSTAAVPVTGIVTRVRALHTFEPTEPGELAFDKGDIIKVVDRGYKDWWRGQLKGRTGIFPVNYVEPMPEPTAVELAKEAEQEAAVFAQAVNVEKLLTMLRALDPAKDNLADNEEIQELYRSSMALRPKVVKLIDKYSQKRADLVSMNETFVRARSIFDRMMEESLARHTGVYDQPSYRPPYVRPDSRAHADYAPPGTQNFGWNPNGYDQPGYNAFPAAGYQTPLPEGSVYPQQPQASASGPAYVDPNAYAQTPGQQAPGYISPYPAHQQPYGPQGPIPYPAQTQGQPQQQQAQMPALHQDAPTQPIQNQQQLQQHGQQQAQPPQSPHDRIQARQSFTAAAGAGYQPLPEPGANQPAAHAQHQQSFTAGQGYQPLPEPGAGQAAAQIQSQVLAQPAPSPEVQGPGQQFVQAQAQQSPQQQLGQVPSQLQPSQLPEQQLDASQAEQQPGPSQAAQSSQQPNAGPPYVFDPSTTYADPNVQAWAQYYVQGGKDPSGAVYFYSVPGITDNASGAAVAPQQISQTAQQPERQQSLEQAASPTVHYPEQAQYGSGGSVAQQAGAAPGPHPTATTPAWVLPRHASASSEPPQTPSDRAPGAGGGAPEYGQHAIGGGPPVQQFAGISLSDNGPVGA